MENAFNYLTAHPVIFVIAIIAAVMILFSTLRKLLRLLLIAAAVFVLYAAYVHFTGGDVHTAFSRIEVSLNEVIRYLGGLFSSLMELFKSSKKK